MRVAAAALLLFFASACNRPRFDTPENAYVSFSRLLQKDDVRGAYQCLSKPTRELLAARAKELAKTSGGSLREDPAYYLFTPGLRAPEVTKVQVVKQEADAAVLTVESAGQTQQVRMVKEGESWRVDLSEQLKAAPGSGATDGAHAPG